MGLCKTITRLSQNYNQKQDPTVKAARALSKKLRVGAKLDTTNMDDSAGTCRNAESTSTPVAAPIPPPVDISGLAPQRIPIKAELFHQIQLRDQGRCKEFLSNGQRCSESKWIDLHHIVAVSEGGQNTLENIITLCKGHHRLHHFDTSH